MTRSILLVLLIIACLRTQAGRAQSVETDETETLQMEGAGPPPTDSNVDAAQAAEIIIRQTNDFRRSHQRDSLESNKKLNDAAQSFAEYMAQNDRYGHHADGSRPSARIAEQGYAYCLVAENIAYQYYSAGFTTDRLAEKFVTGWKESPGHRENMLDADIREIGAGIAQSQKTGVWYAVQEFARPKSAAISFQIANHSGIEIDYTLGKRSFQLPPRYSRSHTQCRQTDLNLDTAGGQETDKKLTPHTGDAFVVTRAEGEITVEKSSSEAASAVKSHP